MSSLATQLFDAGIAPEGVNTVPCITDDGRGGAYTGWHVYYLKQTRWDPEHDWNDAAYYVERYGLRIMPVTWITQPEYAWFIGVSAATLCREFYERTATFAEVPAAICRLVLRLHQAGMRPVDLTGIATAV